MHTTEEIYIVKLVESQEAEEVADDYP